MEPHRNRQGHAAIAAIISDIENYLPPPNTSKPGYAGCRTTYGLLTRFHQRAETSESPDKEYKELQQIERDLRHRINSLESKKGVPDQITRLLNHLRDALAAALAQGVTRGFCAQDDGDADADADGAALPAQKESRKMVTERRFKKVWDELQDAKALVAKLNRECNALQLRVRRLEAARGPGPGDGDGEGSGEAPPPAASKRNR